MSLLMAASDASAGKVSANLPSFPATKHMKMAEPACMTATTKLNFARVQSSACHSAHAAPCISCLQDAQPIVPTSTSLCGGGRTTWMIIGQDLPVPFTTSYAKPNGCAVNTTITSALPACSPATSSTAQQAQGISCLPGMVTIPNPNVVRACVRARHVFNAVTRAHDPCLGCKRVHIQGASWPVIEHPQVSTETLLDPVMRM